MSNINKWINKWISQENVRDVSCLDVKDHILLLIFKKFLFSRITSIWFYDGRSILIAYFLTEVWEVYEKPLVNFTSQRIRSHLILLFNCLFEKFAKELSPFLLIIRNLWKSFTGMGVRKELACLIFCDFVLPRGCSCSINIVYFVI